MYSPKSTRYYRPSILTTLGAAALYLVSVFGCAPRQEEYIFRVNPDEPITLASQDADSRLEQTIRRFIRSEDTASMLAELDQADGKIDHVITREGFLKLFYRELGQ